MKINLVCAGFGLLFLSCNKPSKEFNKEITVSSESKIKVHNNEQIVVEVPQKHDNQHGFHPAFKGYYLTEDLVNDEKDTIHELVKYYINNAPDKLVKTVFADTSAYYTVETQIVNEKEYFAVRLIHSEEGAQSTLKWLYIDPDNDRLYEYDLPNDELIPFIE